MTLPFINSLKNKGISYNIKIKTTFSITSFNFKKTKFPS